MCLFRSDDRQWVESQKRLFRTFVFQSTRYLSSSTGNGLLFDSDTDDSMNASSGPAPPPPSTKQIVLVEVSDRLFFPTETSESDARAEREREGVKVSLNLHAPNFKQSVQRWMYFYC